MRGIEVFWMGKHALRSEMSARRAALPDADAERMGAAICSKILALPAVRDAASVGIYISMKGEARMELLFPSLRAARKKVFVPVISERGGLRFAELDFLESLVPGPHGTLEPREKKFAAAGHIGAFIVPGLAFDVQGFRVGWGKGYDDQFFAEEGPCVKVGAAYDFQIAEKIAPEPHDVRMDFVVTEKRIIKI